MNREWEVKVEGACKKTFKFMGWYIMGYQDKLYKIKVYSKTKKKQKQKND